MLAGKKQQVVCVCVCIFASFVVGTVSLDRVRSTGLRWIECAVAVCCSVLQCVAVWFEVDLMCCCSVLQCVAVCCSVLQCSLR